MKIDELVKKHVRIALGSSVVQSEEVIADVIAVVSPELTYVIVSKPPGAYAVTPFKKNSAARLPRARHLDRPALQDPLSELVKIGAARRRSVAARCSARAEGDAHGVVESCVNQLGDINTAGVPLLRQVSGSFDAGARS